MLFKFGLKHCDVHASQSKDVKNLFSLSFLNIFSIDISTFSALVHGNISFLAGNHSLIILSCLISYLRVNTHSVIIFTRPNNTPSIFGRVLIPCELDLIDHF